MDPQLTSLVVSTSETARIEETLDHLIAETGANYSMLLDKSGQVIAWSGDTDRQDITSLGALLAGTFASSREVARLLKEKEFKVLFSRVFARIFLRNLSQNSGCWSSCSINEPISAWLKSSASGRPMI